jgi:hypothetical protein
MEENIFARMDFIRRAPQQEEKRVTRDEFHAAIATAVQNLANDPKVEGIAKFIIPSVGMVFSAEMEEILFGKKEG